MPLRIGSLRCRVKVKAGASAPPIHRDSKPGKPTMAFALPVPDASQSPPEPSRTATEGKAPDAQATPSAAAADARQVADRVYDLMLQEVRLARHRGQR